MILELLNFWGGALVRMETQGPDPSGERRNLGLNLKKSVYWVEVLHDF